MLRSLLFITFSGGMVLKMAFIAVKIIKKKDIAADAGDFLIVIGTWGMYKYPQGTVPGTAKIRRYKFDTKRVPGYPIR